MKVIIIHAGRLGGAGDTVAVVEDTSKLVGINFTEIDPEDSTGYMTRNRSAQLDLQRIFNDIMGMFGFSIKPKEMPETIADMVTEATKPLEDSAHG